MMPASGESVLSRSQCDRPRGLPILAAHTSNPPLLGDANGLPAARSIRAGSISGGRGLQSVRRTGATASRRAPSSTPRWMWASRCSTRATATARRAARRSFWAPPSKAAVTTRSSPPSSPRRWATVPCSAAARVGTSCRPSRTASTGCERTISTSIRCTDPTRKTPIEETLSALDLLVRQGKVRYIGHSNFAGWQIAAAAATAERANVTPFLSAQNQYSLLDRHVQAEVIPACEAFGLSLLPYFPLASGLLSGKYRPGEAPPAGARLAAGSQADRWRTPSNVARTERLRSVADAHGRTLLELAMSWLARQPVIASVIAGASRPGTCARTWRPWAGRWVPTSWRPSKRR